MKQREFERGLDLLIRAKAVNQNNPQIYNVLGYIYKGMGQRALAREEFNTYLKLYPSAPDKSEIEGIVKGLE